MTEMATKIHIYKLKNSISKYGVPTFIDYRNSDVQNMTSENNITDV